MLVYHIDRLTRRPIELEQFLVTVDAAKVRHVRFVTGDTDISTGDGLLVARMLAAVAASESATKARRVKRKAAQNAAEGKPHVSHTRPFGYEHDGITIRTDEAEVLRQVVARFLAGESMRSLATWLTDQEIPTVTGNAQWASSTLRNILRNPRYAGLRAHHGQIVAKGIWEPIITDDDHRRVLAKMEQSKHSGRRTPQRYLLSGLLRCSKCGVRLYSSARRESNGATRRRYVCLSGPDHGGCGRLTIVADPLERLIADAVLFRLDTPELADTLAGRSSADQRTHELTTLLDEDTQQLEELADAYAQRHISMTEWLRAKKPITARLEQTQRQLARMTRTTALTGLVGNGQQLGRSWSDLNLSRQNAIVAAIIDHAVIGPGTQGATMIDPARVTIVWRH